MVSYSNIITLAPESSHPTEASTQMHETGQEGHSQGCQNATKKKLQVLTHYSLNKSVQTAVAANPAPYYRIQTQCGLQEHQKT